MTAEPVMTLVPVTERAPSLTLVAIVKLLLKFNAGVKVTPISKVLTLATAPEAVQIPVPATYVEVTAPDVAVLSKPAAVLDSVNVTVTLAESTSVTTMSVRFNTVSSV